MFINKFRFVNAIKKISHICKRKMLYVRKFLIYMSLYILKYIVYLLLIFLLFFFIAYCIYVSLSFTIFHWNSWCSFIILSSKVSNATEFCFQKIFYICLIEFLFIVKIILRLFYIITSINIHSILQLHFFFFRFFVIWEFLIKNLDSKYVYVNAIL